MMPGEKAQGLQGKHEKACFHLAAYKVKIIAVVILALLSAVFTIAGPKVLAQATNELFAGIMNITAGGTEGINFARIGSILMVLLGLYVISAAFMYLQGFIMTDVSTRAAYDLKMLLAK